MPQLTGRALLNDSRHTKSTAFTRDERERYGLRGLLPYNVADPQTQKTRVLANLRRKTSDIERYVMLNALLERNQTLFYRTLIDNIEELMPLVYTPTVGQACKEFANIFRKAQGFYITPDDRGQVRRMLDNWPEDDVRVIVVTDGERILGLGDLGANGMGIPIGKLELYIAGAGILPRQCMPVMLDVGTNNEALRNDPLYLGFPAPRMTGGDYDGLVEEFVRAVQDKFPRALIQFEDFLTPNAYALLHRYRYRVLCFNDDIQGTAAVTLAGVYASTRLSRKRFADLTVMFLGAGSAATGIADLLVAALCAEGLDEAEARRRLWFVDIEGLIVADRDDLLAHNLPYAHDHPPHDFLAAIDEIRPDVLIGATGAPGTFNREVVAAMTRHNEQPAIFALSNPTDRAECTAEQAYDWSEGRAIFASGSPFAPVRWRDRTFRPGQGNNAYIFPGIGLGAVVSEATRITDEMFLAAARILAAQVGEDDLAAGAIYPPLPKLRDASLRIAVGIAEVARAAGLNRAELPDDLEGHVRELMYDPRY